jgi:hypothetical protein
MKQHLLYIFILTLLTTACSTTEHGDKKSSGHEFNGFYSGEYLSQVAFPIGGIGAEDQL